MQSSTYLAYFVVITVVPAILYLLLAMLATKHGYDFEAGKISFRKSESNNQKKINFTENQLD